MKSMRAFDFEHNGKGYYAYQKPPPEYIGKEMGIFFKFLADFYKTFNINPANVNTDLDTFTDIIVRVDQRKLHYRMYHKGTKANQLKIAAIYSYWIAKYKPLTIEGSAGSINDKAAMYFMACALKAFCEHKINLTPQYIKDLLYSIRNRIHSYDSFVAIIESLAVETEPKKP